MSRQEWGRLFSAWAQAMGAFAQAIKRLVGGSSLQIRFWGVRGSIACGGPDYVRYGGNTSCVEADIPGLTLIFDAGTGLRGLGEKLQRQGCKDIQLFLSHTHFDHVCGFPFFAPAYDPSVRLTVWSGHLGEAGATQAVMAKLMEAPLFPVDPGIFKAQIAYRDFQAGETITLSAQTSVRTAALNHPNGATGYRLNHAGAVCVYASDLEHQGPEPDEALLALSETADLLIYDATYTDEAYGAHKGWGHSTWQEGVKLAHAARARTLALYHHDPSHTDPVLAQIEREAKSAGRRLGLKVFAAREGFAVKL